MADTTKKASVQIVNEEQENMAVTEVETTEDDYEIEELEPEERTEKE